MSTARIAVDSVVSVEGVLSHVLADDHSLERRELLVPSPALLRTVGGPPADPYAIAEVPVQQPPAATARGRDRAACQGDRRRDPPAPRPLLVPADRDRTHPR